MKMEVTQSIIIVENTVEYMLCLFYIKSLELGMLLEMFYIFLVYLYYGIMCGVFFCMKCHLYYINVVSC